MSATSERPAAFDRRLQQYMPALRSAARKLAPEDRREDVVQDACTYVLTNWQRFRGDPEAPRSGFYRWLMFVLRDVARSDNRVRQRRERIAPTIDDATGELAARASVPASQEDHVYAGEIVRKASKTRGGRILLRMAVGDTLKTIGRRRGIHPEYARLLGVRARRELKEAA